MPRKTLRKPVKKETPEELAKDYQSSEIIQEEEKKPFRLSRNHVLTVSAAIVLGVLFILKGLFIAAVVNGQPISRLSVISELEKQGGKKTLESLIVKTLILQEGQKQGIKIEQKEIDSRVNNLKDQYAKQGLNLDQSLAAQGWKENDLVEQYIRPQIIVEKIVGKDIKVTDKEVGDYIEKNKDALSQNASSVELKKQIAELLRQQKLEEKVQNWMLDLQKKANVLYFVNY